MQIFQVFAALLDDHTAYLDVNGTQKFAYQPFATSKLSFLKSLNVAVVALISLWATCNVGVGVVTTILQTPGAEAAAALPARQRKAPLEIDESLAAILARALQRQELFADVLAVSVALALLCVHPSEPPLLILELLSLLRADLLGQP
jgi:hypothetical protein